MPIRVISIFLLLCKQNMFLYNLVEIRRNKYLKINDRLF